jgi:tetratricopeptide (TPR) repeat protein
MKNRLLNWLAILFLVLLVNTAWVWAFTAATVFYMANVLLHLALGVVLTLAFLFKTLANSELLKGTRISLLLFLIAAGAGGYLAIEGNLIANRNILYIHIVSACLGVVALAPFVWKKASEYGGGWLQFKNYFRYAALAVAVLPLLAMGWRRSFPEQTRVQNPLVVPAAATEEGGGPKSPFFPSSAKTNVGGIIPSNFFMDSQTCGECHKDAYEQWKSSSHHFGSFNNQFYRKSIEYMQDTLGSPQQTKWCAGCHDHAVFFNGRFEKPIKEQIDTPEAQAGLACTSCHAISHVEGTMGNGGFTIEYPALHELMTSKNKLIKASVDFMTYLNPEPHRRTFLKPFMKDSAEFCSACHKVHLDIPVNDWRWFRGFNDYDNWQSSGFGEGARSFYYPPAGKTCSGCHMEQVDSQDPGNRNGKIHGHSFATANTALSVANKDEKHLADQKKFLTSGFISVDIFGASQVDERKGQAQMVRRAAVGPQLNSGGATGEESDQTGDVFIREVGKVSAPLDKAGLKLTPGSTARVDVVVRTRKIGHFFPGGTLDAFDIWVEFEAKDATGKPIYWSGRVDENGSIEPGAHMYKAYQLDAEGNPINKRNAWQARSVLYVHAIQPGAADTVHYLVRIPKDAKGPITLSARLNHRKFSEYYTKFAYAGQPEAGQDPSLIGKDHNSLKYSFAKANIPANVSGEIKGEIPDNPITVLAQAESKLELTNDPKETEWKQVTGKTERERWNDWGIGLLLQGDIKGAEYAFTRVTEAEPAYADGWLNVARALIQEGETEAAKPFIAKALEKDPKLGRIYYFRALIEKADGDYDAALKSLMIASAKYPRDRVVLNQIARIYFLQRKYRESIDYAKRVSAVDPEDLQMHYTAMLAYRGAGDAANAQREQTLFQRFKTEESSQSITQKRRLFSPEDNNERQSIHDHDGIDVGALNAPQKKVPTQTSIAAAGSGGNN